jgi:ribosomal protein L11 methyltransferase
MACLSLMLDVDAGAAEALSDALLDAGAFSVSFDGVEGARCRMSALVGLHANADVLLATAAATARLAVPPDFSVARIDDEDWVRRSQAQFAPVRIGERLWVGPSWEEPPPRTDAVVRLDPGLAFGTGSHPSTRLVLRFLEQHVRGGERVLDYGCGSGVLAIAAAKLGAAQVDAVDVDPEAVQTAADNARANDVAVRAAAPDALAPALYDLVVSNILAQPLILLAPLLAARTTDRGRIALSGILQDQAAEVADAYAAFFDVARSARTEEGWALIEGVRR